MVRLLGFILLLLLTVLSCAAVLSLLPLDWPLWARLGAGIGASLVLPTVAAMWLFSVLHRREVESKTTRIVLVLVIAVLQGGLVALAVFGLGRTPNDLLTAAVALFMEPKQQHLPSGDEPGTATTDAGATTPEPTITGSEAEEGGPAPGGLPLFDAPGETTAIQPGAGSPAMVEPVAPPTDNQPRSTRLGLEAFPLWSKRLGTRGHDSVIAAAVTGKGEIVVAGKAAPEPKPELPPPAEGTQISLTFFDGNGNQRWNQTISATRIEARDIGADSAGNVFVLGAVTGPVDFGRGPVTIETHQVFLLKLLPTGAFGWLQLFQVPEGSADRVALAKSGEIMVAGTFAKLISVGGRKLESKGSGNLFVVKLSPSGEPIWLKPFGESRKGVRAEEIGFYRDETIIVGQYVGGGEMGKSALQPLGPDTDERGVFMLRLSQKGKPIAMNRLQYGFDQGMGFAAAIDPTGAVIFARGFWGEVKGDAYDHRSADALDLFIGKFDRDGRRAWSHSFGGTHDQAFPVVAVDQKGRVFVAGSASLGIDLGHGLLTATGTSDVFAAVLSPVGTPAGSCLFANNLRGGAGELVVDKAGKLFLVGTFADRIDFGGGVLQADVIATNPQPDIFVAKLSW